MKFNVLLDNFFSSSAPPEKYVEKIQKEVTSSPSALNALVTHNCIRHVAKNSPNPELFLQKYDELISKK